MQSILNTAVDGIILIDERGRIEAFNPAAERIFGYPAAQVLGKNVSLLMPDPHRTKHQDYIHRYLETGEAHIIGIGRESQGQRADGSLFPLELAISEMRIGKQHLFTGIVRDISERKRLERAIVDASEMERKQIGQDLHDTVSQHLAGLTMLARVLEKTVEASKSKAVQSLQADVHRLVELASISLKQVKDISHGLYPVELERNGLSIALQQFVAQQDALFGVECRFTSEISALKLDRSAAVHLYRIAQEAVSNAIKHAQASRIDVSLRREKPGLRLEIRDNGCGMRASGRAQSHGTSTAGLGLAIMNYRAKMIGAELVITSIPDKGTQVAVPCPTR
jgi:two-component system, LuxR family, sensor kinase FixL